MTTVLTFGAEATLFQSITRYKNDILTPAKLTGSANAAGTGPCQRLVSAAALQRGSFVQQV